jgi:hypothetical protein
MEQDGWARKREEQSCIYGTMRSSSTNIMRMKWKLLGRDRNSQLMTMTDSNDIFTSHMSVVLADTACDFKGIPNNRKSQYIMVRAPNNMPS